MWTLKISKDRHKFSSSHFTIFSKDKAEALHGHNYYVSLEIEGEKLNEQELLIDIAEIKTALQNVLEAWDEKVLLPSKSKHLEISEVEDSIKVEYSARTYSFPTNEVKLLSVKNITMESLAKLISDQLHFALKDFTYTVRVSESHGQEASYHQIAGTH